MKKLLLSAFALFFLSLVFINCSCKNESSEAAFSTKYKDSSYLTQSQQDVAHNNTLKFVTYLFDDYFIDFNLEQKEEYLRNLDAKEFGHKLDQIRIDGEKLTPYLIRYTMEKARSPSYKEINYMVRVIALYFLGSNENKV